MKSYLRYLLTGSIVLLAIAALLFKYRDYVTNPWTRDGQVQADVIEITPRVSGPIVHLPIRDNQFVQAGDLLFEIDPRTFEAALEQARAQLAGTSDDYDALFEQVESAKSQIEISRHSITQAEASIHEVDSEIEKNEAELHRQREMLPQGATALRWVERAEAAYKGSLEQRKAAVASLAQARAALAQSTSQLAKAKASLGAAGEDNPDIRVAQAAVKQAELNLEFTEVKAPVDGYVTNLNLRLGSHTAASNPALALVDVNSYWIQGFFKENTIANIQPGDRAIVTLMTYPDTPLEGSVDSLGWGIAQEDGSTGYELLPNVSATFEWIRLAQRVPVRIHLDKLPEEIKLRIGMTASVLVMAGAADESDYRPVPPVPKNLQ